MFLLGLLLPLYLALFATGSNAFPFKYAFSHAVKRQTGSHYLFLFGDSYTRVTFNIKKKAPSASNPIGNPSWPGVTTSGGINWGGILGSQYNTSLTLIWDYGFGGATINKTLIRPPNDSPVDDLSNQVAKFKVNMTGKGAPRWSQPHRSVFAAWFGQNDVYQAYYRKLPNPNATFDIDIGYYFARMDDLYQAGARDFLWIGVAPIVRSPLVQSLTADNQTKIAQLSTSFNNKLAAAAQNFSSTHTGLTWRFYDPAPAFNRVLDDPQKYGVASSNNTCYNADGVTCAWWNHFHPGIHIHEQVAADIAGDSTFGVVFKPSK